MLAQTDVGARQLSDLQRRTLTLGNKAEGLLLGVVLCLGGPFALMVASSLLRGVSGEGAEARRQLLAGCSYLPTLALVGGLGAMALWQLRRMRRALEASCAALPPGRDGEPAGCRVCGGPVVPRGVATVARCPFCQADNLVAPEVVRAAAPARRAQVSDYAQEITAQAQALQLAGRSRALLWVAALPLCTCLCGCPNLFLGYRLGLAESETATCEHVLVDTPEGLCVGERRGELTIVNGAPTDGRAEPISGSRGMPRVRERGTGRAGQVAGGLLGARVCGARVRVRWDDESPTSEVAVASLCWE